MSDAGDNMIRTESGLYLPGTPAAVNAESEQHELTQRLEAQAQHEVAQLVAWAESWGRNGRKPMDKLEIRQACLVRAQIYLWPPEFMFAVYGAVVQQLGLVAPPQQKQKAPTRTERRAAARREARPVLKVVDPSGDGRPQEPTGRA